MIFFEFRKILKALGLDNPHSGFFYIAQTASPNRSSVYSARNTSST